MEETVREIIKRRDNCGDEVVDDMLADLVEEVADGYDPEEAIASIFGLEPDYLWDGEVARAIEEGFAQQDD